MKGFQREDPYLSLCGLNCKLCSMQIGGHCGGCGFGNQSCPIARCSLAHGGIPYCIACPEYPCDRYGQVDAYDSFITHLHRVADLEKMQRIGVQAYHAEQARKRQLLDRLLEEYNDGRKKTIFCLAVNLLELDDLSAILEKVDAESRGLPIKEKAGFITNLLQMCAAQNGVSLKLRKKPPHVPNPL